MAARLTLGDVCIWWAFSWVVIGVDRFPTAPSLLSLAKEGPFDMSPCPAFFPTVLRAANTEANPVRSPPNSNVTSVMRLLET